VRRVSPRLPSKPHPQNQEERSMSLSLHQLVGLAICIGLAFALSKDRR